MNLRQYTQPDIAGKRALLRLDLDVETNDQGQVDEFHDLRLERSAITVKQLLDFGAAGITLCGHRGRPSPSAVAKAMADKRLRTAAPTGKLAAFSMSPVKDRLEFLLNKLGVQDKIELINDITARPETGSGRLVMLENLRFWPGEKNNDANFARQLSAWGEPYVNDAFGVCHRNNASLVAITAVVKQSFVGPNLVKEVEEQEKFLSNVGAPFVVVLGGVKISTKLPLIKNLLPQAQAVLLGGGLANTVLAAHGVETGRSVIERGMLEPAKDLGEKIVLPQDFIVLSGTGKARPAAASDVSSTDFILDIGPKTSAEYAKITSTARSVLWNGPMGKFEDQRGRAGTEAIAQTLSLSQAMTLAGGGDTVAALEQLGLVDKFGFVSIGGGAMLTFLAGGKMPGLEPLKISN